MYKVRNETRRLPVRVNTGLSLYKACSQIENVVGGLVLSPDNRLVSFWCAWTNSVKTGFGANQYEKDQVNGYYGREVSK